MISSAGNGGEWRDALLSGRELAVEMTFDVPDEAAAVFRQMQEDTFGADKWELGTSVSFDDFGMKGTVIDRKLAEDGVLCSAVLVQFPQGSIWINFESTEEECDATSGT